LSELIGDVDHPLGKHQLPSEPLPSLGPFQLGGLANIELTRRSNLLGFGLGFGFGFGCGVGVWELEVKEGGG
jgi:hypothetical protein